MSYYDEMSLAGSESRLYSLLQDAVWRSTPFVSAVGLALMAIPVLAASPLYRSIAWSAFVSAAVAAFLHGLIQVRLLNLWGWLPKSVVDVLYDVTTPMTSLLGILNWYAYPLVFLSVAIRSARVPSRVLGPLAMLAIITWGTSIFSQEIWRRASWSWEPIDVTWVVNYVTHVALGLVIWRLGVASLKRFHTAQR